MDMAHLEKRPMQYIYQDGDGYVFMDPETYEQITLTPESAGDGMLYLKEGMRAHVLVRDGKPLGLEPPSAVALTVAHTDVERTKATANGRYQIAVLQTGLKLIVPAFIRAGETIVVDTRNGRYLGRVMPRRARSRRKRTETGARTPSECHPSPQ